MHYQHRSERLSRLSTVGILLLLLFHSVTLYTSARYVYLGNLTQPILPYINNTKGDLFGSTISISKDGTTMIIGANYVNNGKGYAYWYKSDKLKNPPEWIFQGNLTTFPPISNCYYGGASALSHNGLRAIIGAPCWTGQAAVSFFERNDTVSPWRYVSSFSPSGWVSGDRFGSAIACNYDCSTVVIGVPFRTVNTGTSYGNAGVGYVCTLSLLVNYWLPTNCTLLTNPRPASSMYFGTSVSMSYTGATFVIGSDGYGAWVYELNGPTYAATNLPSNICDPNYPTGSGNYGEGVGISGDGNAVLVGGPVGGSVGAAVGRTLSHNRLPDKVNPGQYIWNCTQSILGPSGCQGPYSCDNFLFGSLVRLDYQGLNAWITSANLASYFYNRSGINETWRYIQPMRFPSPGSLQDTGKTGDIDAAMSMPVMGAKGSYFSTIVEGYGFAFYDPERLSPSASPSPTSTSSSSSTATATTSATSTMTASSTATNSATATSSASGSASATNTATATQGSSASNTPSNTPSTSFSNTPSPSTTSTPTANSTGPDNNNGNGGGIIPESISGGGIAGIVIAGMGIVGLAGVVYVMKFNTGLRVSIQKVLRDGSSHGNSNGGRKNGRQYSSGQVPRQASVKNIRPGSSRILLTNPFPTTGSTTIGSSILNGEGSTMTKVTFNPTAVVGGNGGGGLVVRSSGGGGFQVRHMMNDGSGGNGSGSVV